MSVMVPISESHDGLPPLVQRATNLASAAGFSRSCLPEVGRLLYVLTGSRRDGIVGEIGTGYGVGTAWMAAGLSAAARLVTVELEPDLAQAAAELFQHQENVRILAGDWRALVAHGPFNMLFIDAGTAKSDDADTAVSMLAPGGLAVLDDLTPLDQWPEEWQGRPDPVRDFWLHDSRLLSTEVLIRPDAAVILAVRL